MQFMNNHSYPNYSNIDITKITFIELSNYIEHFEDLINFFKNIPLEIYLLVFVYSLIFYLIYYVVYNLYFDQYKSINKLSNEVETIQKSVNSLKRKLEDKEDEKISQKRKVNLIAPYKSKNYRYSIPQYSIPQYSIPQEKMISRFEIPEPCLNDNEIIDYEINGNNKSKLLNNIENKSNQVVIYNKDNNSIIEKLQKQYDSVMAQNQEKLRIAYKGLIRPKYTRSCKPVNFFTDLSEINQKETKEQKKDKDY
jgi:hypothetical protein